MMTTLLAQAPARQTQRRSLTVVLHSGSPEPEWHYQVRRNPPLRSTRQQVQPVLLSTVR
ncbi:hypothetical protein FRAAL5277 [Frankia alni ACN14a]|uniref:Uncharacterized protein n=1 Tax=Frankia alni (strain DSM 45986 / CECT 9034 / ACN14a) TaxID=326424 RepID=Q0RF41_FRAAA|nr:hypothetical protein FRAAL5277 [Frankia alni ACN14a]